MTLNEYREKYLHTDNTDFDTPTKELAEAWLDAKIDAMDQLARICKEQDFNLVWGLFNKESGDFENEVSIGGMHASPGWYSIHRGIDKLAKILGVELKETARKDTTYPWEYSFDYKGHNVWQISEKRLENKV